MRRRPQEWEALELRERVPADYERLLGPHHPDTFRARKIVARAHGAVEAVQQPSTATTTAPPTSEPLSEDDEMPQ